MADISSQESPLDNLGDVGRGLLFVSLFAKGSALTENGAGFLKDLVLRRDPRVRQVISKFENATEGEGDPSLFEEVNHIVDIEAMKCHRRLFPSSSTNIGVDFFAIVGLFRELGINKEGCKFASLGSVRVGVAARISFDFDAVIIASKVANRSFRDKYVKAIASRLSTTKVQSVDFVDENSDIAWSELDVLYITSNEFKNYTPFFHLLSKDTMVFSEVLWSKASVGEGCQFDKCSFQYCGDLMLPSCAGNNIHIFVYKRCLEENEHIVPNTPANSRSNSTADDEQSEGDHREYSPERQSAKFDLSSPQDTALMRRKRRNQVNVQRDSGVRVSMGFDE